MKKFLATVLAATFMVAVSFFPPVAIDVEEASAQGPACELAIDQAKEACDASESASEDIGSLDELIDALELLALCIDNIGDAIEACAN